MRPGFIAAVAGREILSTLRDGRAVLANLLIPLLVLPLVTLGLPLLIGGLLGRETVNVSQIGAQGLENLPPALVRTLQEKNIKLVAVQDAAQAVRSERLPGALEVPNNFTAALERGNAPLVFYHRSGGLRNDLLNEKVAGALEDYGKTLTQQRLERAGLDPRILSPIALTERDASTAAQRASGSLSWLVPFFIMIWTLTGGQMVAIDATAGEKERGTLEALLVTPVRRSEVVLGKFLATLLFGLASASMAILGFLASGALLGLTFGRRLSGEAAQIAGSLGGSLELHIGVVLALVLSALLLAAFVAALLIAITLFARSFKEAQSYVAPLSLVLVLPVVGLQFSDFFTQGPALYALPAFGTMLLMNELVQGSFELRLALFAWGSSLAFTALLLGFALHSFRRESVLFRT